MRRLSRALLVCVMMAASPAGLAGKAMSGTPQAEDLFDFWIGDWSVSWTAADGSAGRGRNQVARILDGKVIEENFEETPDGKTPPLKGRSLSVLRQGVWRQAWCDNQGGFFSFTAQVEGDRRMFVTDWHDVDGQRTAQRMVFHSITTDSLTWDWQRSVDGGRSWTLLWRIKYRRRGS